MENKSKKDHGWIYVLIGLICVIVSIVSIILFLLQGDTKTTSGGKIEVSETITCEGDGIFYPLFKYDNSKRKTILIKALFNDDKFETINLVYKLDYDNIEQAKQSNNENHAAMNKSFAADSLSADSFEAHYSDLKDGAQMALYAKAKELNGVTAKYFLLDGVTNYTKDNLTKKYNDQGLNCIIKDKS